MQNKKTMVMVRIRDSIVLHKRKRKSAKILFPESESFIVQVTG